MVFLSEEFGKIICVPTICGRWVFLSRNSSGRGRGEGGLLGSICAIVSSDGLRMPSNFAVINARLSVMVVVELVK